MKPFTAFLALTILLAGRAHAGLPQAPTLLPQAPPVAHLGARAVCGCNAGGGCPCIHCDCLDPFILEVKTQSGATVVPDRPLPSLLRKKADDGGPDWTWDTRRGVWFRTLPPGLPASPPFFPVPAAPILRFPQVPAFGAPSSFSGGARGGSC
jgi:hypothetical protein